MIAGAPLTYAAAATLAARHLTPLTGVDQLARRLEAGMPIGDAVAELRGMASTARAPGCSTEGDQVGKLQGAA